MSDTPILLIPGFEGSGPDHWQSQWRQNRPNCHWVEQSDWNAPVLEDWLTTLHGAITACEAPPVLVAHSLGCALVAHWFQGMDSAPVAGVLMVAPADVDSDQHIPAEVRAFGPMPLMALPCRAIVAASRNDPYVDYKRAVFFSTAWGASLVDVGEQGHINAESGLGAWDDGWSLVEKLMP